MNAPAINLGARSGGPERATGGADGHSAPPVTLTLPMPPSVNEAFRNVPGRGRVKTNVYRDWLGHAGWQLKTQRPDCVPGPVLIVVSVERSSSAADVDNRIKALFDLLVKHHVIDDDSNVVGFCAAWAPPGSKLARVMVLPAANLTFDFRYQRASSGASFGGWFLSAPSPQEEFA